MANEQNLRPVRTKKEARERGSNGGKKSVEVQRQKKTMREIWNYNLSHGIYKAPRKNKKTGEIEMINIDMEKLPENVIRKAMNGDVTSLRFIAEFLEGTKGNIEHSGEIKRTFDIIIDGKSKT